MKVIFLHNNLLHMAGCYDNADTVNCSWPTNYLLPVKRIHFCKFSSNSEALTSELLNNLVEMYR